MTDSHSEKVRTRFAPSPTGFLHVGGARTALFNWAFAKHHGGDFFLRIEDTDIQRSTQAAVNAILEAMQWLQLDYQGEVVYQTQRFERYQEVAQSLINKGLAYYCYASKEELDALREAQKARGEKPRYDGRWRDTTKTPPAGITPVIRFRNPDDGAVSWDDLIKGPIAFDNQELDDFVIMRGDGVPTYNFAVVVDDWDMAITHVIRGDDHVNNTPKQINIYEALGAPLPRFGHLPMIHGPDGDKLSKRHGAVNVMDYKSEGYLPEALLNYLARLGFSHGDEEIFSMHQLAQWFKWSSVQSSPARFDQQKLQWVNQTYLHQQTPDALMALLKEVAPLKGFDMASLMPFADTTAFAMLYRERSHQLTEVIDAMQQCVLAHGLSPTTPLMLTPDAIADIAAAQDILKDLVTRLNKLTTNWNAPSIHAVFQESLIACQKKMPHLGMPLRLVLMGAKQTPSVDKLLACLKPEVAIDRINKWL